MPTDRDLALVKAALEAAANRVPIEHKRAIRSLDPAAIVASQRICLVCGRSEPCTETPEACTFDPTPQELYAEIKRVRRIIKELHAEGEQLRQRIKELEAELAGKRQSPIIYPQERKDT